MDINVNVRFAIDPGLSGLIASIGDRIMSKLSDALADIKASQATFGDSLKSEVDRVQATVSGLTATIDGLKAQLAALQAGGGEITPEDQAQIDEIKATIAAQQATLDAVNPTVPATLPADQPTNG